MALGLRGRHAGGVEFDPPHPHKRLFIALAVATVVLLVVAALAAKPVYHWVNRWRALQSVEASIQAQRTGDAKTAIEKAQTAMHLWPYDASVVRQMAMAVSTSSPTAALPFWQKAWSMSHDLGDLRNFVETAIDAGNFPLAVDELTQLQKLDANNAGTWKLVARIRLSQNNVPEALDALKKVMASPGGPADARLLYAQTELFSADPATRADGLDYLRMLAARTDEFGLRALRALVNDANLPTADYDSIAKRMLAHPQASRDDKLAALRLEGLEPGADEDTLVKTALGLFPNNDADGLVTVARWLRINGRPGAALKIIDPAASLKRQSLFNERILAMADLRQWTAMNDLLNQPNLPLQKENLLLLQALTLSQLGQGVQTDLAWERIHNEVADQPKKLLDVAIYAIHFGLDDIARPALQSVMEAPEQRRVACEQLVQLERRDHHTEALHDVLAKMAGYYPQDLVVRNDLLYTGFLLGEVEPEELAAAQKLVADNPHMLSFRFTLAEGLLADNKPVDALQVFSDLADSTMPTNYNHWNAVYVAVLRANGQLKKADYMENFVKPGDLLIEEQKLLDVPLGKTGG